MFSISESKTSRALDIAIVCCLKKIVNAECLRNYWLIS